MSGYFIGRQPILDRELNTIGYELLFRSSFMSTVAGSFDGDKATSIVMTNAIAEFGLDSLVGNKLAFFNMTEKFMVNPELIDFLDPDKVVLEVLEDIPVTEEVIKGATSLVQDGYTLALDDFIYTSEQKPLLKLAKLIKYDFTETPVASLVERVAIDHQAGRKVLVERIETAKEHEILQELGVDYFQGYFFAKPTTLSISGIPSNKLALIKLYSLINDPDSSLDHIVDMISQNVGLVIKILRYVNSTGSSSTVEINSIQQAAALLGRNTLRNWVSVMVMADMDDKPLQLINMALYRAKFCELMAEHNKIPNVDSCFTVGMLSLLNVMIDSKLEDILESISISDEIKSALIGDDSAMCQLVRQAIQLECWCNTNEGESTEFSEIALRCYRQAIVWADEIVSMVKA